MTAEASVATVRALKKEAEVNNLISGLSRREALEAEERRP
jgi:hypothetical protein